VFVIGYLGDKIESFITETYPNINASFVVQSPRRGIGHAVWLARDLVKDEELLIALGDTIFDVDLKDIINSEYSSLGVKKVDNPTSFGIAELDSKGFIIRLVEKPNIPKSNLALVGLYKIKETAKLIAALDYNIEHNITSHNEFHLTDGIMRMVEGGAKITTFVLEDWYDCGSRTSLLETNALLLKRDTAANSTADSYENTIIIPPVRIADGCVISNSIIGPNVSIGENTIVKDSIIKDSIIGSFSELKNAVLHQSILGSDASLKGLSQSLNIGDSTEIDFS
jgi:glucose-1-phosphate thymidylyltransferase